MDAPRPKPPIFQVAESSPVLLDKHAAFLQAGGDRLLTAVQDTVQSGLWPWDKPAEQTAQFGAFCAGVAWVCKLLRELNVLVQNRQAMGEMVSSALSSASDEEQIKAVLIRDYGYTEEDFNKKK
jgi:hypothetical protein